MLEQQGFESGGLCSAKGNVPSRGAGGHGKDEALAQRHSGVQEIRVRAMGAKVSLRGQESQIEFRSQVFRMGVHISRPSADNRKGDGDLMQPALEDLESTDMWKLGDGDGLANLGAREAGRTEARRGSSSNRMSSSTPKKCRSQ